MICIFNLVNIQAGGDQAAVHICAVPQAGMSPGCQLRIGDYFYQPAGDVVYFYNNSPAVRQGKTDRG